MKERYSRFMDNIAPEKSDEELFSAVLGKAEKKKNIKTEEKKILKKRLLYLLRLRLHLFFPLAAVRLFTAGFHI